MKKSNRIQAKTVSLLLLTLAAIFVTTACGGSRNKAGDGDLETVKLILDWTPNTNHTGFYAAQALGYYKDAGLEVEILQPAEGTAEQLVAVGQGDFGVSIQENVTYALTQDDPMPIKSVATILQHNTSGFLSLKEAGIESPGDWEGKTYGGWGSPSEENVLRFIADKYGIAYEKINYVNLGQDDVLSAFRGEVDFAWVFEAADIVNFNKLGVQYNYIPARDIDGILDYYTPLIITSQPLIDKNPDKVKRFIAATAKGYEYAVENPEEAAKILLEQVPELDEYVVTEGQKYLSARYAEDAPQWGYQTEEIWRRYADLMFNTNQIPKKLDITAAFTNEFLPKR
jgi:ABC-type nitrate/sulfonate/bicarbonate transport system substrate-binding protein